MNILEALWYGNISPIEQDSFWSEERKDLQILYDRNRANLEATLDPNEKEILEKMDDCYEEMQQYAECNAFIAGFRLAVQLMAASLG